ncbi:MAG TPA: hypothetical protein VFD59_09900 [Nocardioidaceae bacterium]|nr:hypothetical protein [Nocardioidaceae bacterium]
MEVMFERVAGLDVGKASVTVCVQTPLLGLVRDQLRPPPVPPQPSAESLESRDAYEAVVAQQVARVGHAGQQR